jgi:hypothetical protein
MLSHSHFFRTFLLSEIVQRPFLLMTFGRQVPEDHLRRWSPDAQRIDGTGGSRGHRDRWPP